MGGKSVKNQVWFFCPNRSSKKVPNVCIIPLKWMQDLQSGNSMKGKKRLLMEFILSLQRKTLWEMLKEKK